MRGAAKIVPQAASQRRLRARVKAAPGANLTARVTVGLGLGGWGGRVGLGQRGEMGRDGGEENLKEGKGGLHCGGTARALSRGGRCCGGPGTPMVAGYGDSEAECQRREESGQDSRRGAIAICARRGPSCTDARAVRVRVSIPARLGLGLPPQHEPATCQTQAVLPRRIPEPRPVSRPGSRRRCFAGGAHRHSGCHH